jgi:hypothetical protein
VNSTYKMCRRSTLAEDGDEAIPRGQPSSMLNVCV